jgi:hypothetical protein
MKQLHQGCGASLTHVVHSLSTMFKHSIDKCSDGCYPVRITTTRMGIARFDSEAARESKNG